MAHAISPQLRYTDGISGTSSTQSTLEPVAIVGILYRLDLEIPSVTVDASRTSSLLAVHPACQGIRQGEATMASSEASTSSCTTTRPSPILARECWRERACNGAAMA